MDISTKLVTVDTNLYEDKEILEIGRALPYIHLFSTKITEGELGKKVVMGFRTQTHFPWSSKPWGHVEIIKNKAIPAILTVGRSTIGGTEVIVKEGLGNEFLKSILKIATNGSFRYPQDLSALTNGKKRQLNDALILQAHCNREHDIIVSNDMSFFGRDKTNPKRSTLEKLCNTQIMSGAEFKSEYQRHLSKYRVGNT